MDSQTLFTVKQLADTERAFSEASIRWLLFQSSSNGLDESGALVRLGRRVLIDRQKFLIWLVSNGARASVSGKRVPAETVAA